MCYDVQNFFNTELFLGLSGQDPPDETIFYYIGSLNPVGQTFEIALRQNYRFFYIRS